MVVTEKMVSLPHSADRPEDGDNDACLFALLGCPNGSGIVRMLTDRCNRLGHKTVAMVLCYFTLSFTHAGSGMMKTLWSHLRRPLTAYSIFSADGFIITSQNG